MKLVGIAFANELWVARVDGELVHPLATVDDFWNAPHRCAASSAQHAPVLRSTATHVPYVPGRARVFCVGLNYKAHAAEGSFEVPQYPALFGRWTSSLSVDGVATPVPRNEPGIDWEGEVAAYIGLPVQDADETQAMASVFGYSVFNDLTARTAQKLTSQWTLGKNGDRSGPMGPLVTRDESGDPAAGWSVITRVNGVEVQHGNTRDMIFSVAAVISLISKTVTLEPGDMIATGTPAGVGYVRNPPWLLTPGDSVEVSVDNLGTVTTPIISR